MHIPVQQNSAMKRSISPIFGSVRPDSTVKWIFAMGGLAGMFQMGFWCQKSIPADTSYLGRVFVHHPNFTLSESCCMQCQYKPLASMNGWCRPFAPISPLALSNINTYHLFHRRTPKWLTGSASPSASNYDNFRS